MKDPLLHKQLQDISDKLHRIIKILSIRNTEAGTPAPWLDLDSWDEAKELREKNPQTYDYVCEMLKLFFC